jgi:uridine kinase
VAVRLSRTQTPAWVRERLADRSGTRWVGVDGLGAAGKTTLAGAIAAALPGAVVIGVDDFARPGVATWDHDQFRRDILEPLLHGRPGSYRRWDLLTEQAGARVTVPVGVPVVVEGVSATDRAVEVPWDLQLWVEAGEGVRRARINRRDPPALLTRWAQEWWPREEAYLRSQRPDERADAVVGGG